MQNSELGRICSEVWELAKESGTDDRETVTEEGLVDKGLSGKRKYEEKEMDSTAAYAMVTSKEGEWREKGV